MGIFDYQSGNSQGILIHELGMNSVYIKACIEELKALYVQLRSLRMVASEADLVWPQFLLVVKRIVSSIEPL